MNREIVIETLLGSLRARLSLAENASRDAADYATNEESRAESEWDTQGIEASYLAAGQAAHARELMDSIQMIQGMLASPPLSNERVVSGSLVQCRFDQDKEWLYFAPTAGGEVFKVDGMEITVVTPQSPLGHRLSGLTVGASFDLPSGATGSVLRIL